MENGKWKISLSFFIGKYIVRGSSMSPTLHPGDTLLASSLPYLFQKPKIGDIIVCRDPRGKRILIKRVAKIRENEYFIVGDSPKESTDSRQFGFIKRKDIMGKVIYKIDNR